MSSGQWSGKPGPQKTCFMVELPDFRGAEYVHATNARVDGGAVIFTNGAYPAPSELVTVFGPRGYVSVIPMLSCSHEED